MKNLIKTIGIAIVLVMIALGASAQILSVSATSAASANIIAPLTITKTTDMNFGDIAVLSTTPGTVILSTTSTRSSTGGSSPVPNSTTPVTAAAFTVTGTEGYEYVIDLPSSCIITNTAPIGGTMTVDTFVHDQGLHPTIPLGGTGVFHVGATLHVDGAQNVGLYTNATAFTVTIHYF